MRSGRRSYDTPAVTRFGTLAEITLGKPYDGYDLATPNNDQDCTLPAQPHSAAGCRS